jgi:hypothetical protein
MRMGRHLVKLCVGDVPVPPFFLEAFNALAGALAGRVAPLPGLVVENVRKQGFLSVGADLCHLSVLVLNQKGAGRALGVIIDSGDDLCLLVGDLDAQVRTRL